LELEKLSFNMAWSIQKPQKDSIIILEAMVDQETWICHAFFRMPGSCNDINVLQRSPLMTRIALSEGPPVELEANGHKYTTDTSLPMASTLGTAH
jgi:hypothetical protein